MSSQLTGATPIIPLQLPPTKIARSETGGAQ